MNGFAKFGNDLYTGRRSIDFMGRRKVWFALSAIVLAIALAGLFVRGLNLGLEFTGGSEFRVSGVTNLSGFEGRAKDVVTRTSKTQENVTVTQVGSQGLRIQTEKLDDKTTQAVANAVAKEFGVPASAVSSTFVGPSWGQSVTQQALKALIIFFLLVALVLAVYFRTWKMSLAALLAMVHDMVITIGIYTLVGFEITPATMIGFLTVLGYSLYDTVVVFDKVKENTHLAEITGRQSYSQAANLAVNQTLVRSINTSMVSIIPITVVLLFGLFVIGPGVLLDLALVLLVGILVGAYSSIFIASPILAWLRESEPSSQALAKRARKFQESRGGRANASGQLVLPDGELAVDVPVVEGAAPRSVASSGSSRGGSTGSIGSTGSTGSSAAGTGSRDRRPLHPSVQQGGPRNQPRRTPRSQR
ncbi:protein translocase subunit SecF [Arsenicicoccus piscis]|uniref:Protein-export membrane protein SecF n=1 Tax=Arsenicicoccus piscis TaxID=673954 RepID=A0ABQ6HPB7_9MICO|nr:protein translocase subunit SecF [Arsenicicoccus piscis]MCH8629214.1 protein translocase subunit SecF [Arsenicicoccus piscis]GMA19832.1 protein-export membrane protein SecF [Arsenicicoccus piscis]